ncbi:hypothetical protein EWB00_007314 [Schistosoma japonicum]|uniref:Uncharacterized protein n=1 Tax=Schistosoma japonicum TaxID=6182 RepID=A0A4Z2CUU5_SCHJA|nr:hypothetical protein EWB00_007314 [Schistosoma japonicum]
MNYTEIFTHLVVYNVENDTEMTIYRHRIYKANDKVAKISPLLKQSFCFNRSMQVLNKTMVFTSSFMRTRSNSTTL